MMWPHFPSLPSRSPIEGEPGCDLTPESSSKITKLVSAHKDMSQKVAENEASMQKTTAVIEERVKSAELQLRRKEEELAEIKEMLKSVNGETSTASSTQRRKSVRGFQVRIPQPLS
jgi:hypothetical protein